MSSSALLFCTSVIRTATIRRIKTADEKQVTYTHNGWIGLAVTSVTVIGSDFYHRAHSAPVLAAGHTPSLPLICLSLCSRVCLSADIVRFIRVCLRVTQLPRDAEKATAGADGKGAV